MTELGNEEETHSSLGPSAAHRWMECPGSVTLSEGIPNTTSEHAEEGTRAHELGEYILHNRDEKIEIEADAEMLTYVREYTNFVLGELNRCQTKQAGAIPLQIEEVVTLFDIDERLFGTVDAMFYSAQEGTLYVFDLKYGKGIEVDVDNNAQLMYYALAGWSTCFANKVVLTIVQPRIEGVPAVKRVSYSTEDMNLFAERLKRAIYRVDNEPTTYNPGPKQCQWCLASAICPAMLSKFTDVTTVQPEGELSKTGLPSIKEMTPERLGDIYSNASMLRKWLDDVGKRCADLKKDGVDVPNTKMVRQRKNRVIKDPKAAKALLIKKGYRVRDIEKTTMISPTQLEALGVPDKVMSQIVFSPKGKLVLAPISDKRKEVVQLEFEPSKEND